MMESREPPRSNGVGEVAEGAGAEIIPDQVQRAAVLGGRSEVVAGEGEFTGAEAGDDGCVCAEDRDAEDAGGDDERFEEVHDE